MSFLDSRIEIGAIISAITQEHANRAIHLIERRGNLRVVVDVTTGGPRPSRYAICAMSGALLFHAFRPAIRRDHSASDPGCRQSIAGALHLSSDNLPTTAYSV